MNRAAFLILILGFFVSISESAVVDSVIATIDNEPVTFYDYIKYVKKIGANSDQAAVNERILRALIDERLILNEAKNNGFVVSDHEVLKGVQDFLIQNNFSAGDLEKKLSDEGMSLTEYQTIQKESIISLKFIDREVNSKVLVHNTEITDYYRNNIGNFIELPEKILVQAVFFKLSSEPSLTEITDLKIKLLKIKSDLKNGDTFERIVAIYADEALAGKDGILGEFEEGSLIPALDQKLFLLKEGEVSEPVWTKGGIYILKALKRIQAKYKSVENVMTRIYNVLYEQKREEIFNRWMKNLWEKSSVKIK